MRLTLLAPEIVEAILDGRQRAELKVDEPLGGVRSSGTLQQISLTVGNDPYTVTSGQFAGDPA